jgi:photosystem II stability/assembly factor-like uncharacterized protein
MKKQLLTLFIITTSFCSYAQWINQNVSLPYNGYINSMEITDANTVWGNPWNASASLPYTRDFVRTIDGGNTWTFGTISSAPASYNVSNIWPLNADTAFAAMWNDPWGGGVFRTYDGGTTWTQVGTNMFTTTTTSFLNIVYFWDDMNGLAAGDPVGSPLKYEIWLTSDGGNTWTQVPGASLPALTNAGEYGITNLFDAVQGYFWFATTYGDVYRSTDMGLSWTKSATGLPANIISGFRQDITDIAFSDSLNGLVLQSTTTGYILLKTSDGGITWSTVTPLGSFYSGEIEGIPGTNFFVSGGSSTNAGFGSSISYDAGNTWTDISTNVSHTSFAFLDPNNGYGGEFINTGSAGGAWKWIGTINCGSILINSGIITVNNDTICFGDTLVIITSNALSPTVGTVYGSSLLISSIDISGNNDPLNQSPGVILGGAPVFSGNPPTITLVNSGNPFPAGTYFVTPLVLGNATGPGPNIYDYTLDPACTYTGSSVMVTLLAAGDPLCIVGIEEDLAAQIMLSSYFTENNLLSVNVNSIINETASLEIYDLAGRLIYNQSIRVTQGNNQVLIDVKNITPGAYFINLKTGNYKAVNKIVKF